MHLLRHVIESHLFLLFCRGLLRLRRNCATSRTLQSQLRLRDQSHSHSENFHIHLFTKMTPHNRLIRAENLFGRFLKSQHDSLKVCSVGRKSTRKATFVTRKFYNEEAPLKLSDRQQSATSDLHKNVPFPRKKNRNLFRACTSRRLGSSV